MIFSLLIAIVTFSCSDDESTDQLLYGTWIEQSPMANRTEVVIESNGLMRITLQNSDYIRFYTIVTFKGDSIELSDNLADMNNNVKFYFKTINDESIIMENFYDNEDSNLTFKKR